MRTLSLIAIALGFMIHTASVHAGCGSRPGTPNEPRVQLYNNGHVHFTWRATHGRSDQELIMSYDIQVWEQATGGPTRVLNGVPPTGAAIGPDFGDAVGVIGFPRYGERAGHYFTDLPLNVAQCFSVRARTEQGTEGCVSEVASAPLCITPSRQRKIGKRR